MMMTEEGQSHVGRPKGPIRRSMMRAHSKAKLGSYAKTGRATGLRDKAGDHSDDEDGDATDTPTARCRRRRRRRDEHGLGGSKADR